MSRGWVLSLVVFVFVFSACERPRGGRGGGGGGGDSGDPCADESSGGGQALVSDMAWDPALEDDNQGFVDLGAVWIGEVAQPEITLTNISDKALCVEVIADLDAAVGWIFSFSESGVAVYPDDLLSVGPRLTPNASTPPFVEGQVTFAYDEVWVTYAIYAEVMGR